MRIRFGFYIICTSLVFLLFSCANAVEHNPVENNTHVDGGSLPSSSGNPLAPFAGSYSSSDGTYNFNSDGTGSMSGSNQSARSAGGITPFTWEITTKDANNANLTYGMLYVGNAGSGITFDTGGAEITVLINGKVYGKGSLPSGGSNSPSGGQQGGGDSSGSGNSSGGDNSGSGGGSQGGSSSGGQQGGGNGSQDGGSSGGGNNTPSGNTPTGSTPESQPTPQPNGNYLLFAPGVTKDGGWHDVNKTGGDNDLCWAATSSNLVAWWQDLYVKNGGQLPSSVKTRDTEIFSLFKTNFGNTSGTYINGLHWYFVDSSSGRGGGYLLNCVNPQDWNPLFTKAYKIVEDTSNTRRFTTISDFSSEVIAGLKKGAMGLKLTKSGQGGHAITLWGAEYNSSNQIVAVYVTDSDDHSSELKRYELEQKTDSIMLKNYSLDGWQLDKIHGIMILYAP